MVQKLELPWFARLSTRKLPPHFNEVALLPVYLGVYPIRSGGREKALIPEVLQYFDHTGTPRPFR
jgi:hypothetical protein